MNQFQKSRIVSIPFVLVLLSIALAVFVFLTSPEIIPVHFNLEGEPNGYGNRSTVLFIPILCIVLFAGFSLLIKNPDIMKKGKAKWTEQARSLSLQFIKVLEVLVLLIFNVIILIFSNQHFGYLIPVLLIALVVYNVLYFYRFYKLAKK